MSGGSRQARSSCWPPTWAARCASRWATGWKPPGRAQLIPQVAYRTSDGTPALGSFSEIEPAMQERITFLLGGRYEGLRDWLRASTAVAADSAPAKRRGHAGQEELDFFLGR